MQVVAEPTTFGPTAETVEAYKQAVFATVNGDGPAALELEEILEASWRLPEHFKWDRETYSRRLEARRILDEEVPRLRKQVEDLRQKAEAVKPERLGQRPIDSFKTLGELAAALDAIRFANDPNVVHTTRERREWKATESNLSSMRITATNTLQRTADPAIDNQVIAAQQAMRGIKIRIADRQELVDLPERIARMRAIVKSLARGETPPELAGAIGEGKRGDVYRDCRQRLRAMLGQQGQREGALNEQQQDQAELVRLEVEVRQLHESKLDPANMQWATID